MAWENVGLFNDAANWQTLNNRRGVYLWIYEGTPHRIIYVGTAGFRKGGQTATTTSFKTRFKQNIADMTNGKTYVIKTDPTSDIYKIMSYKPCVNTTTHYLYLQQQGILWIPGEDGIQGDWERDWQPYVNISYMPKIRLWLTQIDDGEEAYGLESRLQFLLSIKYSIGYYRPERTWLGRIEKPPALNLIDNELNTLTTPVPDSEQVLSNIEQ